MRKPLTRLRSAAGTMNAAFFRQPDWVQGLLTGVPFFAGFMVAGAVNHSVRLGQALVGAAICWLGATFIGVPRQRRRRLARESRRLAGDNRRHAGTHRR